MRGKKKGIRFKLPPSVRPPIEDGAEILIRSEPEHAFFLRCWEVYRVLELADRTLDSMIESYSKYRTRDLFRETFALRYFDFRQESLDGIDSEANALLIAMFNVIHELRITLMHEDALPFTVKSRIEGSLSALKKHWDSIVPLIRERNGWKLKAFAEKTSFPPKP